MSFTKDEVQRLVLATVAGHSAQGSGATREDLFATTDWADGVRIAEVTLDLVLLGQLVIIGFDESGEPMLKRVDALPPEVQTAYAAAIANSGEVSAD